MTTKKIFRIASALVLLLFASLTLFLSSSVIFDWFDIRAKEGNYVLFIVWANFICSLLYLLSVYGFLKAKSWTRLLLSIASIILIVAFITLQIHITNGGVYETKTVGAMLFRIAVTLVFTTIAFLIFRTQKNDF